MGRSTHGPAMAPLYLANILRVAMQLTGEPARHCPAAGSGSASHKVSFSIAVIST